MQDVRVQFVARENGPERLVCEGEIVFENGPLAGMKLVGFSLWRGADGDVCVTFPSRSFGAGHDRRFFDYLRPAEIGSADARRVKEWILAAYNEQKEAR